MEDTANDLGFHCTYYIINKDGSLSYFELNGFIYLHLKYYKFSIPNPIIKCIENKHTLTINSDVLSKIKNNVLELQTINNLLPAQSEENQSHISWPTSSSDDSGDESSKEAHNMSLHDSPDTESLNSDSDNNTTNMVIDETINLIVEQYYVVIYDTNWYIGRIISVGLRAEPQNKNFYQIKFLKEDLNTYIWPKTADIQDVNKKFIIYGPISLQGSGPFSIKRSDRMNIIKNYKHFKSTHF